MTMLRFLEIVGVEWDEAKNQRNLEKHGLAFPLAVRIFQEPVLVRLDDRFDYGEDRFLATGTLADRCVTVVFTLRSDGVFRLISARRANTHEQGAYRQAVLGRSSEARSD